MAPDCNAHEPDFRETCEGGPGSDDGPDDEFVSHDTLIDCPARIPGFPNFCPLYGTRECDRDCPYD